MIKPEWWFNIRDPRHVLGFLAVLVIANAATWYFATRLSEPAFTTRKPIVILEVIPHQEYVDLGEPYGVTIVFEKTRVDCENGRLVRHMWGAEEGAVYLVEDIETVVSDGGVHKIALDIPTSPLDPKDEHLMTPGIWSIKSKVTYDCPVGENGENIQRDMSFSTPIFEVRG